MTGRACRTARMRTDAATGLACRGALPWRVSERDPSAPRAGSSDRHAAKHRAAAGGLRRRGLAAMTRTKTYVAVYERDSESDAWLVHIKGIAGCHTYGR